jgi:hypothetical protein
MLKEENVEDSSTIKIDWTWFIGCKNKKSDIFFYRNRIC